MRRDRGGLWEPVYGGHTELRSSKDVKYNLGNNIKNIDKRGSRLPGTLYGGRKEVQGKSVHSRIVTSQGPIVFYRSTVCVHHIESDNEGDGCQGVGSSIRTT